MTHIITREMLISTLSEVMTERDAAEKVRDQYRDDYSKTLVNNTKLREENDQLKRGALAHQNSQLGLVEELKRAMKNACSCEAGPHPNRALREEIEQLKRENMLLKSTDISDIKEVRIRELQVESDKNAKAAQMAEQEVRALRSAQVAHDKERRELRGKLNSNDLVNKAMHADLMRTKNERDELKAKQCQCVPVLEKQVKKLEESLVEARESAASDAEILERTIAQLPDGMKTCTIRYQECEHGHGYLYATNWINRDCPWCTITARDMKLSKIRSMALTGMNSCEMLQSLPPKNLVAYRILEILDNKD